MIEMIEKISEFLKENISPKAHNLMSVIVVLSSISALVCAIYNSLFLLYLGVGFNKTGIGFYDLIIFDQCLIIFSLLIFLHFIFSIFVLNAFLKIATLFFLLAITTSREVLQNNGYLMDSYWLALIFISVVIAVIGGGGKTIEIVIFGEEKKIPTSWYGKILSAFIIACVFFLLLGMWLKFVLFSQELRWFFTEKAFSMPKIEIVLLVFLISSWWLYIYFLNSSKVSLSSMSVIILFYVMIQPLFDADKIVRHKIKLDKIEIELANEKRLNSFLIKNFSSGALLMDGDKISFVKSEYIVNTSFLGKI